MKKFDGLFNFAFGLIMTGLIYYLLVYWQEVTYFKENPGIFIVLFLIVHPWRINNNIWSLLGGINNNGSVYSLIGIFQLASEDAACFLALSVFQKAGIDAFILFGLSLWQKAGVEAYILSGLSFWQKASDSATMGFGIALFQSSKKIGNDLD